MPLASSGDGASAHRVGGDEVTESKVSFVSWVFKDHARAAITVSPKDVWFGPARSLSQQF